MDVDRFLYYDHLPTILKRISTADFVAFDLELSGIPTWGKRQGQGRATLQERYEELKEAAEKYQILQIGLTTVEEDETSGRYSLRPFNFNLSPLIDDERNIDVDRDFVYSASAVKFLRNENYDMSSPFSKGVPYLTRTETEEAWRKVKLRFDRKSIPDIQIAKSDTKALAFMERVRKEIKEWQESKSKRKSGSKSLSEYVDVTGIDDNTNRPCPLNRFEKRLIHQIVRSDFPSLRSFSQTDSIRVKKQSEDPVREGDEPWRRQAAIAISQQTGFCWIAEALSAGQLNDLDPNLCGVHIAGEVDAPNRKEFGRRLREIIQACVEKPKILVGHNCLLDLVYLYKFFFGDLPEKVEDFQAAVHLTFPLVMDTKYMATTGIPNNHFRGAQLWEVDQAFEKQNKPEVHLAGDHPQYPEDARTFHEAGFDSFVTAKVFLRLAARLDPNSEVNDVLEPEINILNRQREAQEFPQPERATSEAGALPKRRIDGTVAPNSILSVKEPSESPLTQNRFASNNVFDSLSDSDMEAATEQVENSASSSQATKPRDNDFLTNDYNKLHLSQAEARDVPSHSPPPQAVAHRIPKWDDDFWQAYRNKLRVYGTVEEVCDLESKPSTSDGTSESESIFSRIYSTVRQYLF